jgi:hypothetical protein
MMEIHTIQLHAPAVQMKPVIRGEFELPNAKWDGDIITVLNPWLAVTSDDLQ